MIFMFQINSIFDSEFKLRYEVRVTGCEMLGFKFKHKMMNTFVQILTFKKLKLWLLTIQELS